MKIKCLSCEALARLVYWCAATAPHIVDVELFRLGLHQNPADLRTRLQASIDAASGQGYDAIALAYGLCGQSTEKLIARDIPLVIPRAHDCITLFLGSREKYQEQFISHPGTYWYALDYIQRNDNPGVTLSLGVGETDIHAVYDEYVQKYGKDNADYLMEVMGAWQSHYDRAVYIDMGVGDGSQVEAQTWEQAARRGWAFERMAGDIALIRQLLAGDWARQANDNLLVVPPGQQVVMTYDEQVIGCLKTA